MDLRGLPLHAITDRLGETGLRERFALEIAALPPADQAVLEAALALATRLHHADRHGDEPYVNHLLRTAIRIITYYKITDVDVLAAALLHDSVEDHPDELVADELMTDALAADALATDALATDGAGADAVAVLARRFNPRVARLVAAVTNPPTEPGRDRHEHYRSHVATSLDGEPWARVLKLADFTDNGVGLIYSEERVQRRLAHKYGPLVPILRELLDRPDTPLAPAVKAHIHAQLDLAEERIAIILAP